MAHIPHLHPLLLEVVRGITPQCDPVFRTPNVLKHDDFARVEWLNIGHWAFVGHVIISKMTKKRLNSPSIIVIKRWIVRQPEFFHLPCQGTDLVAHSSSCSSLASNVS